MPELFDLGDSAHEALFEGATGPWEALAALDAYLEGLFEMCRLNGRILQARPATGAYPATRAAGSSTPSGEARLYLEAGAEVDPRATIQGEVFVGAGSRIEAGAMVKGPAWIGRGCEVRQGAYLRGFVLAGDGAVLGHASEFKHCILLEGSQAPHFNYVGDSILGIRSHIGAGVILSNVRMDKRQVRIQLLSPDGQPGLEYAATGLEKLGAILGDGCEVGCNSVLNPGTLLGRGCFVAPLSTVKGSHGARTRIG